MPNNEQNATPGHKSLLDQIRAVKEFAKRWGYPELAEWLTKHADEPCPAAIAQFMEVGAEVSKPRGLSPHNPANGRISGPPESIDGATDRIEKELSATPPSERSRTEAVKEAIALVGGRWIAHEGCDRASGVCRQRDKRVCDVVQAASILLTALSDAERKLAEEQARSKGQHDALGACLTRAELAEGKLAAAEKRAKDAEALADVRLHWLGERSSTVAALTRKLAVVREALNLLRRVNTDNVCPHTPRHGIDRKGELNCYSLIATKTLAAIDAPTGEGAVLPITHRIIDGKFHAEVRGSRVVIVKTSSGEIVPDDEPLMLQRGRDHLMVATLNHYRRLCQLDGCNDYQIGLVDELIAKFIAYASDPLRMKQPGITRGAAWNPDAMAGEGATEFAPLTDAELGTPDVIAPTAEPANAQGSEFPDAEFCGDIATRADPPSAPRFTAEEALERARAEAMRAARCDRDLAEDHSSGVLVRAAEEHHRLASSWRHYAALLDRDDALERAATDALMVLDQFGEALFDKGTRANLRSVLAQRAKERANG